MVKVILTGATGNAGSAALIAALAHPLISAVTTLGRRGPYTENPAINPITVSDFTTFPPDLVSQVADHGAIIWALGISQTKVSSEEYVKITYDYTIAAANALKPLGTPEKPFRFIYVSGEGAAQDESGRAIFSKIKGRTEKALHGLQSEGFKTVSVRPGGILPMKEHKPRMSGWERYLLPPLGAVLSTVYPSAIINSFDLGIVLAELAAGTDGGNVGKGSKAEL
ncbi:hypothetical protein BCR39DRAFT_503294 [Naematelia encephala]|uniref:NAD(P)-binding domain-containing protein n=1 Tax=Naematelia encephala TaxID=71784 RepID=A0A1Y2BJM1_9TREE|nr:hypothetical protein BCR39DRAFT_503294 [Naematelia encephala]